MKSAAILILAVLLSAGTSAAVTERLITSKDIKNGTIQPVDLSAAAKRALKGRRGPAGPEGRTGPAGTFSAQNVTLVTGPRATIQPGCVGSSSASCGANGIPIAGGWYAGNDPPFDASVVESTRILHEWIVTMKNNSTFTASYQTVVTCAIPASG
jgi:hypothetical protein